jgi:threonine/homoserine/homoserine lactone efflux protein
MIIDAQVLAFTGIAALLTVTPGADTLLVIRSVLARGPRAGLLTMLGICCGLFVHASLSALGLSLILLRSAEAFDLVRLLGAAYLIVLGAQSLWGALRPPTRPDGPRPEAGSSAPDAHSAPRPPSARRAFAEGLLNNLLNPKVAVFYLAFLPQFINPGDPVLAKSILLAGIHFLQGVIWLSAVALFVGRLRAVLGHPRVRASLEAVTGLVLVGFGVRLALERR